MPVMSTTLNATHTNKMQVDVKFKSHIIPPSPDAISITITLKIEEKEVFSTDKVLDPNQLQNNVLYEPNENISFTGILKLNTADKIVLFEGGVKYSGQVYVGISPMIIAAY